MGYELQEKNVSITWAPGTELAGLRAVLSLDAPADLLIRMEGFEQAPTAEKRDLMREFGDAVLVEWDMHVKGQPIPATGDGMLRLPMRVVAAVMKQWTDAVAGEGPLGQPSSDTTGLAELSTPKVVNQ